MQDVKYRGKAVFFNGQDYIVPALGVLQFEDNYDKLTRTEPVTDQESVKRQFATFIPIIGMAIRRNYPAMSDDELKVHLDLSTFKECLRAVQNLSGLKEGEPGEA